MFAAVNQKNGAHALEFASAELRADPDVVLSAVQECAVQEYAVKRLAVPAAAAAAADGWVSWRKAAAAAAGEEGRKEGRRKGLRRKEERRERGGRKDRLTDGRKD